MLDVNEQSSGSFISVRHREVIVFNFYVNQLKRQHKLSEQLFSLGGPQTLGTNE